MLRIFKCLDPVILSGIPKSYSGRDKGNAAPDLTRTCNEYWMRPDNHYDMPQLRDRYVYYRSQWSAGYTSNQSVAKLFW